MKLSASRPRVQAARPAPRRALAPAPRAAPQRGANDAVEDVVRAARAQVEAAGYSFEDAPRFEAAPPRPRAADDAPFFARARAAWRVLFPPRPAKMNPREAGKNRLRMILVADRCGMNENSLAEMKTSIVRALSAFVEVDSTESVDVNVSTDDGLGTIYSVAVPVRRIKPQAQTPVDGAAAGGSRAWESDPDADAADRFPYGV